MPITLIDYGDAIGRYVARYSDVLDELISYLGTVMF